MGACVFGGKNTAGSAAESQYITGVSRAIRARTCAKRLGRQQGSGASQGGCGCGIIDFVFSDQAGGRQVFGADDGGDAGGLIHHIVACIRTGERHGGDVHILGTGIFGDKAGRRQATEADSVFSVGLAIAGIASPRSLTGPTRAAQQGNGCGGIVNFVLGRQTRHHEMFGADGGGQ